MHHQAHTFSSCLGKLIGFAAAICANRTYRPNRAAYQTWKPPFKLAHWLVRQICLIAMIAGLGSACFASAGDTERGIAVKRHILVFYDGAQETSVHQTWIHRFAELPLNHLGYILQYRDVRAELPPIREASRYAAILSWFRAPIANAPSYLDWVAQAAQRGVRLIILGEPGGNVWQGDLDKTNKVLSFVGLQHSGKFIAVTTGARPIFKDPELIGFERAVDPVLPEFPVLWPADDNLHRILELQASAADRRQRSIVAAIGPGGGYVAPQFSIFYEDSTNRVKWIINPFAFFTRALDHKLTPIPDVTTVSGRRLYFSHIDADAFNNLAQFPPYLVPPTIAGEVLLKEFIEPFPDLPTTFALVAGDADVDMMGTETARGVVKKILAQPQVEVGSHTYTHPFKWQFFENYDRAAEMKLIEEQASKRIKSVTPRDFSLTEVIKADPVATREQEEKDKYISHILGLPRAYMFEPFDVEQEIHGAIRLTEELAPPGKKVMVYQWSGNTLPFESFIAKTRRAGLRNINGGDTRFDVNFPSVAYVAPISRQVGQQRQIYAVNSNENTYTNEWKGPYYLFRKLKESLDKTESSRRLKAFNLYYHSYAAEKAVSVAVIRQHLIRARYGRYAPVATSHYAAIADSFFDVSIDKLSERRWRIRNRGALQTVRFDNADRLRVNFPDSTGVLGENRHAGSLYVTLDAATEDPVVVLADVNSKEDSLTVKTTRPSLVESRWQVKGLNHDEARPAGFSFEASGFGDGDFVWKNVAAKECTLKARRSGRVLWQGPGRVEDNGRLAFKVKANAIEPLIVDVQCSWASSKGKD